MEKKLANNASPADPPDAINAGTQSAPNNRTAASIAELSGPRSAIRASAIMVEAQRQ